jgi:fructosamine-3-kinase
MYGVVGRVLAENRLRFILERGEAKYGQDPELRKLVEAIISAVAPRLLEDGHLNKGKGITPAVVRDDLWFGNVGRDTLRGQGEEVIFDPSACYAHSEYELSIMKMFGGFSSAFLSEYHKLCPKMGPVEEHDDRIALYELQVFPVAPWLLIDLSEPSHADTIT